MTQVESLRRLRFSQQQEEELSVWNDYTLVNGPAGSEYPGLNYVVEPFRPTSFRRPGAERWTIQGTTYYGEEATDVIFEKVGSYDIDVDGDLYVVHCRYVRREIRSLSDDDREKYFSAVETVYKVSQDEGMSRYGEAYKNITYFVTLHHRLAGARDCDHLHDGLGFLTQHAALTLTFEKVLQLIDPSVSVPYWDYTIEARAVEVTGDIHSWRSSIVFSDDWFGPAYTENSNIVSSGRWAFTGVEASQEGNAFGLLRAPWNMNDIPYLTRSNATYGFSLSDVPSCEDHYDVMQLLTWETFGLEVQYKAHGTVHAMTGGVFGESDYKTFLEEKLRLESSIARDIGLESFATQKNLWRAEYMDCPSLSACPTSDCRCSCPALTNYFNSSKTILASMSPIFYDDVNFQNIDDTDVSYDLLALLCNGIPGFAISKIGDNLESASPLDPSFYPTHPTLDRLLHWRRILKFTNTSWPPNKARSVPFEYEAYCHGHALHDLLPFQDIFDFPQDPNTTTYKNIHLKNHAYTNKNLWDLMDPTDAQNSPMPYIYDTFTWPHCQNAGYPLTLVDD